MKFLISVLLHGIIGLTAAQGKNTNNSGPVSEIRKDKVFHIWEKVEVKLYAKNHYGNPYTDLKVWIDLKGPDFEKRCYGFWDGENIFLVRVMATSPGKWSWKSGSDPHDPGLEGKRGGFTAAGWTESEKEENPNRRGIVVSTQNGHAFQYSDGTPFFLTGDTWWAAPTFRFPWRTENNVIPVGPAAGFKDFVAFRRGQDYNCIAVIAALPNWVNDDKPPGLKMPDGTILRQAWAQAGTSSAKKMNDEKGNQAFEFPGRIAGYEHYFPDVEKINPAYFRSMDKKIDYLNAQGFVPFIEVARRDIGQAWKKYYPWPESYSRYIQYIWSRYQANICLFSPIHYDSSQGTIPADDWNAAANLVIDIYGAPPFGTLAGTNPSGSSLKNWGHVDQAKWLGFHQIGNLRNHSSYELLTEIFFTSPCVPAINGEPYYDGMENQEGGSEDAARYCRSAMYGSVLSGGLGGHIYGAGGWKGGIWSGEVEEASTSPMWKAFLWPSGSQMKYLRAFILSEGIRYRDLQPNTARLSPNRSDKPEGSEGWAFCASTSGLDLFLLYFEKGCPQACISSAKPNSKYSATWFNPRNGEWIPVKESLKTDQRGLIILPLFPGNVMKSEEDWALKLVIRI